MKLRQLDLLDWQAVSHNERIGKKVLFERSELPGLTQFAMAVFPPGECAPAHRHRDMAEVFWVSAGRGEMTVDTQSIALSAGICVAVEPGEEHEIRNTGDSDLVLFYFGLVQ